ncbi:MAG: hypothetical protein ACXW6R_23280, partial [Candidatus Binatia bacterium]
EIPILAYSATSDRDVIEALRLDPRTRFLAKWSTPSLGELVKTIDKILGLQTRIALPRPFIVHGHDDVTKLAVRLDFLPMETTANSAPCVRFEPVKTKIGGQTTSVLSYTGK